MIRALIFNVTKSVMVFLALLSFISCDSEEEVIVKEVSLKSLSADIGTHTLSYAISEAQGEVVVFENGLGDNYGVWSKVFPMVGQEHQVVLYDRGGYRSSELGPVPRDFEQLMAELHGFIEKVVPGRKIYLVGHSLGGALIRAYAFQYPDHIAGLVFVDASHEGELVLTQEQEDQIVSNYSDHLGAMHESEMLIEDMEYMKTVGRLPNVPAVALTSVKGRPTGSALFWADLHKSMGSGLTYFRQVSTSGSGHHIQREEPQLVADAILEVIQRN